MSLPGQRTCIDGVKSDTFFCSGALFRVEQENPELPINYGIPDSPIVMFQRGPGLRPHWPALKARSWPATQRAPNPLESGLLLHPEAIQDKAAAIELTYGKGRILLYGFKPQFRGQSHGTYSYLFNALYRV